MFQYRVSSSREHGRGWPEGINPVSSCAVFISRAAVVSVGVGIVYISGISIVDILLSNRMGVVWFVLLACLVYESAIRGVRS